MSIDLINVCAYDDACQLILKMMHEAKYNDVQHAALSRVLYRLHRRPLKPKCLY